MGAKKYYKQGSKKSQFILGIFLVLTATLVGLVLWWFSNNIKVQEAQNDDFTVESQTDKDTESEQKISSDESASSKELFDAEALQAVLDSWSNGLSGNASIVLSDINGRVLASVNGDRAYFAASLYKLYVAYEGYKNLDSGDVNGGEQYVNGNSRIKCLDIMIRDSNSPCAEKLWLELGKQNLNDQLKAYGINNTDMVSLSTTANDITKILLRIANAEELSSSSQTNFLDSMKDQDELYRRGLPSGFSDNITVHNKVGWNELKEWHDASILNLPDGRQLIVAVLTENVGTTNIKNLAVALEESLLN